ncbi:hypothetical protein MAQ5080_02294 [Marinomonas aquimarina]|uniref:DUF2057 domain-containing protein n=1 Tax=Marinomonas aquimarina TaxID=295068 RepID=A0A1A8TGI2_9GAMM|nr:DUF2057 family protein [Marinomonas aquimarina]SBS32584.1 hypothetical protein MAQ5080_02294 [Marinomonas aquimarina]
MKLGKLMISAVISVVASLAHSGSLHVDNAIELLAVDGHVLKSLNTTPRDLKSGEHQLVFRYKNRLRDGNTEVEFKTLPYLMTFTTLANDNVQLLAPDLFTKSQAELYFSQRNIWRVQFNNGAIKAFNYQIFTEQHLPKEAIQRVLDQYNRAQGNEFVREPLEDPDNNDLLKSIQLLYLQANEDQRQQIKRWIIKQ